MIPQPVSSAHKFFWVLEVCHSCRGEEPPQFMASAPELCVAPDFVAVIGVGSTGSQALADLTQNIQVSPGPGLEWLVVAFSNYSKLAVQVKCS